MAVTGQIEDLSDPSFDPHFMDTMGFGDELDPYQRLHQLRSQGAVLAIDAGGEPSYGEASDIWGLFDRHFMVLSHGAVDEVLNDPITFSNRPFLYNLGVSFGRSLSVMDPPEHTQYPEDTGSVAFRPHVVQEWGDGIVGPAVDELIGPFKSEGRAELQAHFCRPYPFNVIYRMLDLPPEDIDIFYKLTMAQIVFWNMAIPIEASEKLGRYFRAMIEERRANPGTDVVSVIATAEVDSEYLPEEVAISFLRQLINAGGDTTYRTTTALFTGLLSNPDQLEAVVQNRSLVPQAVEEALRWDGPVIEIARSTTRDTVVAGVQHTGQLPGECIVRWSQSRPERLREPGHVRHIPRTAQALRLRLWGP